MDYEDSIILKFSATDKAVNSIGSIIGSMFGSCSLDYYSEEMVPIVCVITKKPWHDNPDYKALNPINKKK